MYFNPFGKVDELINDCIRAVISKHIGDNTPRNQTEFDEVTEALRGDLNDLVLEVALKVEKILSVGHKVSKQIKGKVSLDMLQAQAYIGAHLDSLIYKGFISDAGVDRLEDLLRYVKAVDKRLEKIKVDANKDRASQIELDKLYEQYDKLMDKLPKGQPIPSDLRDVYWMLEELKVSMFAQTLGTKYPVSAKRVKQAMADVEL